MFESITDGIAALWGGGQTQPPGPATSVPDAHVHLPEPAAPDAPPPPPEAYAFLGDMYGGPANQNAGNKPVDRAAAGRAANELFKAMDGLGTNDKAVFKALQGKSPAEIAAIKDEYKQRTDGRSLDDDIQGELSGDELKRARALMVNDQRTAALEALKDAKGLVSATDPQKVKEALAGVKDPAERKKLLTEAGITDGAEAGGSIAGTAAKYALIGSIIPGVGTVVGGIVGGVVGALEGSEQADGNTKIIEAIAAGKDDEAAGEIIKNELHGGLFGHGGILGIGIGRDQSKIESAMETAKDPGAVAAAYQASTGKKLDAEVADKLDGDDKDVAVALLHGKKDEAAAARIHRAKDGAGTKEGEIYKELEGAKNDTERKAIVAAYNRMHAAEEGMDFDSMLGDELSDNDLEKARQLEASGKLDPAFAMKMAMDGAGTDAQLLKDTLKGKSREEIAAIEADYNQRYQPRTFKDDMAGELKISGREGFEIEQALKGDPDTIKDPRARMKAKLERADKAYDFERGSGAGFLDKGVRALSETFGDGKTRSVTDLFSDSGELMDAHHAELAAIGERMKTGQPLTPDQAQRMASLVEYQRDDVDNFRAAKDTVTDAAVAAGTAVAASVAAVVVEVVTAGAATPALVAAISALVGGAGGMGIKAGLQGSGYGNDQIATDALMTIVEAASAGAVQTGPFLKALKAMPGGAKILASRALLEAIKNGATGTTNALARGLLDQNTYREEGGGLNLVKSVTLAGVGAVASSGVTSKMNGLTANQSRRLAGLLGGMAGGAMQTAIDPGTWDGEGAGRKLVQNMAINGVSSMITSGASRHPDEHAPVQHEGPADAPTKRSAFAGTTPYGHVAPVEVVPAHPVDQDTPTRRFPAAPETASANGPDTLVSPKWDGPVGEREAPPVKLEGVRELPENTQRSPGVQPPPADPLDYHVEPGKFNEPQASPEALEAVDDFAAKWRKENGVPSATDSGPVSEGEKTLARPKQQADEPRPFEDQFQERLEGEGKTSRDPDPEVVVARHLAEVTATPDATAMQPQADPERTGEIAGRAEQLARARAGEKIRIVTPEPSPRQAPPPAESAPHLPEIAPEQRAAWERREAEQYARAMAARGEHERGAVLDMLQGTNGDPQRVAAVKDLIKQGTSPERIRAFLQDDGNVPTVPRGAGAAAEPTEPATQKKPARPRPRDEDPVEAENRRQAERDGIPYYGPNDPLPRFDADGDLLLHWLEQDPGNAHIKRVLAEGEAPAPDAVSVREGNRRVAAMEQLRATPEGRKVIDGMVDAESKLTMDPREGSYRRASKINVDPTNRTDGEVAGMLVHEGHHLLTFDEQVDIHNMKKDEYVGASLRNEAEAQAALFEHHRETRKAGSGERELGFQEYHGAYNDAYDDMKAARPELTHDQLHALAREEGIKALAGKFSAATPSTSYLVDANGKLVLDENGKPRLKPGAPKNYDEFYAGDWDKYHQGRAEGELP